MYSRTGLKSKFKQQHRKQQAREQSMGSYRQWPGQRPSYQLILHPFLSDICYVELTYTSLSLPLIRLQLTMQINVVGDSHVLRFQRYVGNTRWKEQIQIADKVAVSGATINQMREHVGNFKPTSQSSLPCVIFLGTNNLNKVWESSDRLRRQYLALLREVRKVFRPTKIVLVSLPLFQRYVGNSAIERKISNFNRFLASLARPTETTVVYWPKQISNNCFIQRYYNGRVDKIHLSESGFQILSNLILQALQQRYYNDESAISGLFLGNKIITVGTKQDKQ